MRKVFECIALLTVAVEASIQLGFGLAYEIREYELYSTPGETADLPGVFFLSDFIIDDQHLLYLSFNVNPLRPYVIAEPSNDTIYGTVFSSELGFNSILYQGAGSGIRCAINADYYYVNMNRDYFMLSTLLGPSYSFESVNDANHADSTIYAGFGIIYDSYYKPGFQVKLGIDNLGEIEGATFPFSFNASIYYQYTSAINCVCIKFGLGVIL